MTFEFENETYHVANPYDGTDLYPHAVLITVGIYAFDKVIVFTEKECDMCDLISVLEDALDALPTKDWDCSDAVNEAYKECQDAGIPIDQAWEEASHDVTLINGGSHYISDWMCVAPSADLEAAARKHSTELEASDD